MACCSGRDENAIGIVRKVESFIANLSARAPESPFNFINLCQVLVLKKVSKKFKSIFEFVILKTKYKGDITPVLPSLFRLTGPTGA